MAKFSIITPVWYNKDDAGNKRQPRYEMFLRCINSVRSQTVEDWEWVIGDDICTPPVSEVLEPFHDPRMKVVRVPVKNGRVGAANAALDIATGEWICWLDADDEYASIYLEAIDKASRTYPEYKMFNFNHLTYNHAFGTDIRKFVNLEEVREVRQKNEDGVEVVIDSWVVGDRPFGSGTIGNGAFVAKKEIVDQIERLPVIGLWNLRDWFFERFPEVKPFFWNDKNQGYNSLGNPWGNDYATFYMLTRKTKCKYLDTALYIVHDHYGHYWKEDPDYLMGEGKAAEWNPNVR